MDQYPTNQQSAPHPSKKAVVIIITLFVLALVVLGSFVASRSTTVGCITPDDYLAFYGEEPLDTQFEPTASFFQKDYEFLPNSATINTNESDSPSIDAKNLASFYAARTDKPMLFTIATTYKKDETSDKVVAEQRAKHIADGLTEVGIPAHLITTTISTYTTSDKDVAQPNAVNSVSLTLAATESCTE